MNTVRIYEKPEQFAEMMQGQLREATGMRVQPKGDDPLLLEVWPDTSRPEEKVEISLHETYSIYLNTGDLSMAVDYLNGMVRSTLYVQQHEEKLMTIDARYLYPAVRDERYVLENEDMGFVSEPFLPRYIGCIRGARCSCRTTVEQLGEADYSSGPFSSPSFTRI